MNQKNLKPFQIFTREMRGDRVSNWTGASNWHPLGELRDSDDALNCEISISDVQNFHCDYAMKKFYLKNNSENGQNDRKMYFTKRRQVKWKKTF